MERRIPPVRKMKITLIEGNRRDTPLGNIVSEKER